MKTQTIALLQRLRDHISKADKSRNRSRSRDLTQSQLEIIRLNVCIDSIQRIRAQMAEMQVMWLRAGYPKISPGLLEKERQITQALLKGKSLLSISETFSISKEELFSLWDALAEAQVQAGVPIYAQ